MVMDIILYGVIFLGLTIGSYSDLKTREVPDWISFGLIFSGWGLRLLYTSINLEWHHFMYGVVGFLAMVALGYMMYYTGQWGGGDSKLLMGVGALLGLELSFESTPQLAIFLINILLVGAIYGSFWIGWLALDNWAQVRKRAVRIYNKTQFILLGSVGASLGIIILAFVIQDPLPISFMIIGSTFPPLLYFIWIYTKSVEKVALYKRRSPDKLTEGDWIAEEIYDNGKRIVGPNDLGVSRTQIKKLIKLEKDKKLKKVLVKEGIPFTPSFLIAFALLLLFGNWLPLLF